MGKSALSVSPRTVGLVLWLLSAAGLLLCVLLVLHLRGATLPETAPPTASELPALSGDDEVVAQQVSSDYLAMARNPLFGAPPSEERPTGAGEDLHVEAVVIGTIIHGDFSVAVVESAEGGQKSLRVGDELAGGTVAQITADGLLLERGGRRIPVPKRASEARRRHQQASASRQETAGQAEPRLISIGASEPAPAAGRQREGLADIEFEDFDAFMDRLMQGVERAEPGPARDAAGNPKGLVFRSVPSGSVFADMGLKDGDVVTDVNGMPVTGHREMMTVFEDVAGRIRNNEEVFIIIDLIREQKPDTIIQTVW